MGADPRRQGALPHDAAADGAARAVPGRLAAAVRRSGAPLHPLRGRERHRDLPAARPPERRGEPRVGRRGRARGGRPPVRRPGLLRLHAEPAAGGRQGAAAGRAGRRPRAGARPGRRARSGHVRPRHQRAGGGVRPAGRPLLPGHRRKRAGDGDRGRPPRRRADRHGRAAGRLHAAPGGRGGAVRLAHRARARARRRCRPRLGGVAIHRRARHVADAGAADPAPHHAAHRLQPAARGAGLRAGRAAADAGRRRSPGRGAGGVQAGAPRLRGAAAGPAGGRHPGRPGRAARAVGPALGRGVARHARLPVGHLRQSAPGDRAGGGRPRRPQRGRRSLTRSRPDAGRGAGRQRGGSAADRAVRRRRQPAAGRRCAAAAIARMRSATASSAASPSASAS